MTNDEMLQAIRSTFPTLDSWQARTSVLLILRAVYKINLTEVVIPAALERRSMSGAAHALVWHFFGNSGTSTAAVDALGIGEITVGGDVQRLLMDYFTAYRVALAGWQLLDRRCGVLG